MALRAHSREKLGHSACSQRRVLARTGASRTQSGLRLTLDTLSHYSPVFIAPLAINSLRRRVQFFSGRSGRMHGGCKTQGGSSLHRAQPRTRQIHHNFPLHCQVNLISRRYDSSHFGRCGSTRMRDNQRAHSGSPKSSAGIAAALN